MQSKNCARSMAARLMIVDCLFLISLDAFGGQIEVLDNLFFDLEEVCEQLDLERRKAAQGLKLNMLRHNRE